MKCYNRGISGNKIPDLTERWARDVVALKPLAQFRAVSKKLADEMKLTFVPFQSMFDQAVKAAPAEFWLGDSIHPSTAGYAIMARPWRDVVGI